MELVLKEVQDLEMFEKIKGYHEKAINKFLESVSLSEEKRALLLNCPLQVILSNSLRTSGGNARMGMFIKLNYRLMKQNPDDIEWIYVHELAHIICQRIYLSERGHGRVWRSVNSLCGFEPKRAHNLNTEGLSRKQERFSYTCGCKIHKVSKTKHNWMRQGRERICLKCEGTLRLVSENDKAMARRAGIVLDDRYGLLG